MSKPRKYCIFCGGFPISKEHVFPDWLREIFPREPGLTHTSGFAHVPNATGKPTIYNKTRPGHSGTHKVRFVCKGCNNGWMSELEQCAKPLLLSLIAGQPCVLDSEKQFYLASWLVKTAMVAEFAHPNHVSIPPSQRAVFKDTLAPPYGWYAGLAFYRGSTWRNLAAFQHTSLLEIPTVSHPSGEAHYVGVTVLGLGHVLFLAFNTSWPRPISIPMVQFGFLTVTRFWPPPDSNIQWPLPFPIEDETIDRIGDVLRHIELEAEQ